MMFPQSLSEIATESETTEYLKLWTERAYWKLPGFKFIGRPPNEDYKQILVSPMGDRKRYTPATSGQRSGRHHTVQWRKMKALNCLVMLFQCMMSQRDMYLCHHDDFFARVDVNLKCGWRNCQWLAEMYVLARRRFIGARGNPRRIAATITDLVDQWISFLDNGCRRQPRQRGVKQHFAAQPLSPPSSDRPVQGRTPLSSCKRKGESLEQGEAKRTHIVFKDEPNDHEEHMDASRNWKQEDAGSDSHGSELIVDDDSKAMSWSPPSIRSRRSRRTTRWSVSVPSPPSPSSTRKEVAADLATVDVAPGTLSDLVQQQDSSRKTKYRKFKAQILDQEQRITALEQQAAERLAAITDLEAKHSKMLDGLSLEVNMMQTWPQSRTGATWEKELMDKVKTAMDEEGRALSHEFSVKMSQQKDSIEQLVGEHSQRQEKATSRLKGQLTQTGQSIEGILDRFQLNHHGDMAKLRSIVAAQASVIEEQGRLMAEMKEQISKLTEKQEDKSVKDDGGKAGQNDGLGNGLLWTPRRSL